MYNYSSSLGGGQLPFPHRETIIFLKTYKESEQNNPKNVIIFIF